MYNIRSSRWCVIRSQDTPEKEQDHRHIQHVYIVMIIKFYT